MTQLRVLSAAQQDLLEIVEYFCAKDESLASDFIDRVEEAYAKITQNPERFSRLETNRSERNIRRVMLSRFPYLVIYELAPSEAVVLAILHASRHPDAWKK